jgi:multidrug efflux pump subunit AcrA (membrane-fusion protein)
MSINKQKLRKVLYIYIAVILILVFSSKTIYNMSLPKVSTSGMPQSGALTKELTVRGVIAFAETLDIYAKASGQIDEMFIKKGDFVDKGSMLLALKAPDTAANEELGFTVERINNQLAALALTKTTTQEKLRSSRAEGDLQSYEYAVFDAEELVKQRKNAFDKLQDGETAFDDYAYQRIIEDVTLAEGFLKITLLCETDNFKGGEFVSVRFFKQTDVYNTIVPNEAIFRDAMGYYIWVIRYKPGALGSEYYTVKVKVKVFISDSDGYHTAISRGFDMYEPVVTSFSKELTSNGRVIRME